METSYVVKIQNKGLIRRLTLAKGEGEFSFEQLRGRIRALFQLPPSAQFGLTYVDKDGDAVTMAEDEELKDALVLQALNPLRVTVVNVKEDVKTGSPVLAQEVKSDEGKEQQTVQGELIHPTLSKSLPVESVANAATVINSDEPVASAANSASLDEKVSNIDGTPESKTSDDVTSPAIGTFVDGKKEVAPEGATGKESQEEAKCLEENCEHPIHFGIKCDGCGVVPISGPRYVSRTKQNFDLCQKCHEASGAEENEYARVDRLFYRIGYPAYVGSMSRRSDQRMCRKPDQRMGRNSCHRPNLTPDSAQKNTSPAGAEAGNKTAAETSGANSTPRVLHMGVQCDECGTVPLEGPRFKSTTRYNYDLCHRCFDKSGSNAREYSRIDQPYLRVSHPLAMRHLVPRALPQYRLNPLSARWVWVLNRMVPILAVDEVEADKKTPAAAGSDVQVGGDAVNSPEAEFAAGSTSTGTSVATELVGDSTVSASKNEVPTEERAVDAKGEESDVVKINVKEAESGTSSVPEAQGLIDVQNVSTDNSAVNNLGETAGEETVPAPAAAEGDLSTKEGLLAKLAAMGFEDPKLNEELLEKNSSDLRKTLDDLCAAEEWDPILGELQEMGFYDANMNRRLMFKNNGSVKRVVKELVQIYKGGKIA